MAARTSSASCWPSGCRPAPSGSASPWSRVARRRRRRDRAHASGRRTTPTRSSWPCRPVLAARSRHRPGAAPQARATVARPDAAARSRSTWSTPSRPGAATGCRAGRSTPRGRCCPPWTTRRTDGTVGVLTGFVTGAAAHASPPSPATSRCEAATAQAARIFPDLPPPTGRPRHRLGRRGVVAAAATPPCSGPATGPGSGPHLTHPHGRVHWAGTETSTEFFGLMEGAIRSGHRRRRRDPRTTLRQPSRDRDERQSQRPHHLDRSARGREQFMTEPDLGRRQLPRLRGRRPTRTASVPFASQPPPRPPGRGRPHAATASWTSSALRDRYAKWYWANGVRAGEPVGVVVAEGLRAAAALPGAVRAGRDPGAGQRRDARRTSWCATSTTSGWSASSPTTRPASPRPTARTRHGGPGSSPWPPRCRRSTPRRASCPRSTRTGTRPTTSSR